MKGSWDWSQFGLLLDDDHFTLDMAVESQILKRADCCKKLKGRSLWERARPLGAFTRFMTLLTKPWDAEYTSLVLDLD